MSQAKRGAIVLEQILKRDGMSTEKIRKELKITLKWLRRKKSIPEGASHDDLIHDALLRIYLKEKVPDLSIKAVSYMLGMIRMIIREHIRNNREHPTASFEIECMNIVESLVLNLEIEESYKLLQEMVSRLPLTCQKIIDLCFYKNASSEEIRDDLNYSSVEGVYAKKSNCIKTLRTNMKASKECCLCFDL